MSPPETMMDETRWTWHSNEVAGRRSLFALLTLAAVLGLMSCSNSVQIIAVGTIPATEIRFPECGTAYVGVDFSRLGMVNQNGASELNDRLGQSIADALDKQFRRSRSVSDLARVETDSADLVVFVRAQNPKAPGLSTEISRSWIRVLMIGVLAEVYNIFALDLPAYRNSIALPFAALALPLYELLYSSHYEDASGHYSIEYQLFILKPDGTVLTRRRFADSAKVMMQADASPRNLEIRDVVDATKDNVSGSVQNYIAADSSMIRSLGAEMKRSYPNDCDRILTFKRNIYKILDDSSSQMSSHEAASGRTLDK